MECHGDRLPGRYTSTGAKNTMSSVMKPVKELHECDVGQPTTACQVMVCLSRRMLVTKRTVTLATSSRDKLWRAMLSLSLWASREGWLHGQVDAFDSHEQGRSGLRKSQIATAPKDTVTLNEKQDEVLPRRKDKTPNDTWVAFGVRSVVAWRHLKTSSHDKLWRAMLLSSLSTSRPRRMGWLQGEFDAHDFRPAQESDC